MNGTSLPGIRVSALALSVAVISPAVTQEIEDAPSTVNATYVTESATDAETSPFRFEDLTVRLGRWLAAMTTSPSYQDLNCRATV